MVYVVFARQATCRAGRDVSTVSSQKVVMVGTHKLPAIRHLNQVQVPNPLHKWHQRASNDSLSRLLVIAPDVKRLRDSVYPSQNLGDWIVNLVFSSKTTTVCSQEHGLLPVQRLHHGRDDVGLRGQHGPTEVHLDHGIRGGHVQGLEGLPRALGHQGSVAVEVIGECRTVHDALSQPLARCTT